MSGLMSRQSFSVKRTPYHDVVWLVRSGVAGGLDRVRLGAHCSTLAQPAYEVMLGAQAKASFPDLFQGLVVSRLCQKMGTQGRKAACSTESLRRRACLPWAEVQS